MLLRRTEKARLELSAGDRTLGLRERALLLVTKHPKWLSEYRPMFGGQGERIALALVQQGFLESLGGPPSPAVPTAPPAAALDRADPASGRIATLLPIEMIL